jgi:hypothetical protein
MPADSRQSVSPVAPLSLAPVGQGEHVLAPAFAVKVRAGQGEHALIPAVAENVPAAQATQVLAEAAPVAAEDVPAAQAMQADALGEVSLRRW